MVLKRVCADSDLEVGDMMAFFIDDSDVLVLRDASGALRAMEGTCPHEQFPLALGSFDGTIITCANHKWCFDASTGKGIRPPSCQLEQYALKVENGEVFVDTEMSVEATL